MRFHGSNNGINTDVGIITLFTMTAVKVLMRCRELLGCGRVAGGQGRVAGG